MEKLTEQNIKNDPVEFDKIYFSRKKTGPDEFDIKRWKKLLKYFRGARLLDMGCLDSMIIPFAQKRVPTAELWGIDLAEDAVADMRRTYPYARFEVMDACKTKYPADYFSYIVLGEVIEHLEFPDQVIREAMRILKPGGILTISTPKEEILEIGAVDKERAGPAEAVDRLLQAPCDARRVHGPGALHRGERRPRSRGSPWSSE